MNQTPGKYDKTSNNKYFQCPAMMNDGRIFTDYRGSTYVNDMIRFSNNIPSSYDYRQFLIHNGNNIMKVNTVNSKCQDVNPNGIGLTNEVPPNSAPQLGMEGNIMGHQCGRQFAESAPLSVQFDRQIYSRF